MREASYVHLLNGRLRVRLPDIRNRPRDAVALRQLLHGADGVDTVDVRPLTGSVLIQYDPASVSAQDLMDLMRVKRGPDTGVSPEIGTEIGEQQLPLTDSRLGNLLLEKSIEIAAERLILALL